MSQIPPLERDHALSERLDGNVPEQYWRIAPPPKGWEPLPTPSDRRTLPTMRSDQREDRSGDEELDAPGSATARACISADESSPANQVFEVTGEVESRDLLVRRKQRHRFGALVHPRRPDDRSAEPEHRTEAVRQARPRSGSSTH